MTDTATIAPTESTLTALDILKQTRDLFAATHWTTGTLYTTDEDGKKKFCMVGGLCHIFAKSEAPEWIEQNKNFPAFYAAGHMRTRYDLLSLLEAEWQLAKTIDPNGITKKTHPGTVEDAIINWNDSEASAEFDLRGDASYVIETMDKTIARIEAENAASS